MIWLSATRLPSANAANTSPLPSVTPGCRPPEPTLEPGVPGRVGRCEVPEDLTGRRVERVDAVDRRLDVHRPAVLDRRRLLGSARGAVAGTDAEVGGPRLRQRPDVGLRDLGERGETVVLYVTAVRRPVVARIGGALRRRQWRRRRDGQRSDPCATNVAAPTPPRTPIPTRPAITHRIRRRMTALSSPRPTTPAQFRPYPTPAEGRDATSAGSISYETLRNTPRRCGARPRSTTRTARSCVFAAYSVPGAAQGRGHGVQSRG